MKFVMKILEYFAIISMNDNARLRLTETSRRELPENRVWAVPFSSTETACIFYRATPYMLARYMPSSTVCLSVASRCSTETAKRRITSHRTPHAIIPGSIIFWCWCSDALAKLERGRRKPSLTVAPNAIGAEYVKIGDFRQITRSL